MAGLLNKIKADVKKSGGSRGKFFYVREGEKARIRFLTDMDDGMAIVFHDSYQKGVNVPCQEQFGRKCPYCDDEELRTRELYAWSVYNYEQKETQVLMYAVNQCTPIPQLMGHYENYGILTDRDFILSVSGKAQNKAFTVTPMDKNKFRNEKVKAFSESTILKMVDAAYPADTDDEDEEDEKPIKKSKKPVTKKAEAVEPDEDEIEDDEEEVDYSEMSAKELYKLCKEREIECQPKKPQKYYVKLLEEYDSQHDDWDDDEDDWEDE